MTEETIENQLKILKDNIEYILTPDAAALKLPVPDPEIVPIPESNKNISYEV